MGLTNREEAIQRIKKALFARTGKSWSVRGGAGTSYGFIFVLPLPKDQPARGTLSPAQALELAKAFGLNEPTLYQGLGISPEKRDEYLRRVEGPGRNPERPQGRNTADTLVKYENAMGHADPDAVFRDVNRLTSGEFVAVYGKRNPLAAERYWKLIRKRHGDSEFLAVYLWPARNEARGKLTPEADQFCQSCGVDDVNSSGHCWDHGRRVMGCWKKDTLLPRPWPNNDAYPPPRRRR